MASVCNSKRDINIKSGNLWCDLTDHLPNYILISNKCSKTKLNPRLVRIFSDSNIDKFKKAISEINWQQLYALDNVNLAYQYFIDLITMSYHTCFPLVKLSRKRTKDKIWITPGLKLSSKHKNKLYKKWLKSRRKTDELNYKNYRKLFKQIAADAEQTYFKQLFDTRINSTKQLWNNLDRVCSFSKNKDKIAISELLVNQRITNSKDICDCFNKYFCTVGEKLSSNIVQPDTN